MTLQYIDSHSSLRLHYQILPFGVRQVLPFQNYKLSTTYYTYVYSVRIFFFKILPPVEQYQKKSITTWKPLRTTEHGISYVLSLLQGRQQSSTKRSTWMYTVCNDYTYVAYPYTCRSFCTTSYAGWQFLRGLANHGWQLSLIVT